MGTVVAARHLQLGHRVAIKLMHPELVNEELAERFMREGQAAARLRSPHVARVLDVGVDLNGAPYLTMEYLDGQDLEQVLQRNGALPLDQAVDYLLQTCEAVAEAHANGIIHRDLKPANLFLARDAYGNECVKVLDFGISKLTGDQGRCSAKVTAAEVVIGTPHYMPPEQMRAAHEADMRADIWALGAIFFEMLTGKPAWSGATLSEVCMRVANDPAPRARDRCPSLPSLVDSVISTCLEKDPEQRYQSVSELVAAVAPLQHAQGAAAVERIAKLLASVASPTLASGVDVSPASPALDIDLLAGTSNRLIRQSTNNTFAFGRNGTESSIRPRSRPLPRFAWVVGAIGAMGALGGWLWFHHASRRPERTVELQLRTEIDPPQAATGSGANGASIPSVEPLEASGLSPSSPAGQAPQASSDVTVGPVTVENLTGMSRGSSKVAQQKVAPGRSGGPRSARSQRDAYVQPASVRAAKVTAASDTPDWGGRK